MLHPYNIPSREAHQSLCGIVKKNQNKQIADPPLLNAIKKGRSKKQKHKNTKNAIARSHTREK